MNDSETMMSTTMVPSSLLSEPIDDVNENNDTLTTTATTGGDDDSQYTDEYTATLYRFAITRLGYVKVSVIDETIVYLDNNYNNDDDDDDSDKNNNTNHSNTNTSDMEKTISNNTNSSSIDNTTITNSTTNNAGIDDGSTTNNTNGNDNNVSTPADRDGNGNSSSSSTRTSANTNRYVYDPRLFRLMIASETLIQETLCLPITKTTNNDTEDIIPLPDYIEQQIEILETNPWRISPYYYRANGLFIMIEPLSSSSTNTNNNNPTTARITSLLQSMNCTIDTIIYNTKRMNQATGGYAFISHVVVPLDNADFLYYDNNDENPINGTTITSSENSTNENKNYNTGPAYANTVRAVRLPTDFYNVVYDTVQESLSVTIKNGQYVTTDEVKQRYVQYLGDITSDWNVYMEVKCIDVNIPFCVANHDGTNDNTPNGGMPAFSVVCLVLLTILLQICIMSFVAKKLKSRQRYNIEQQRLQQQRQMLQETRHSHDMAFLTDPSQNTMIMIKEEDKYILTKEEFDCLPTRQFEQTATTASTDTTETTEDLIQQMNVPTLDDDNKYNNKIDDNHAISYHSSSYHQTTCSICVEEFIPTETVLVLPRCHHVYHVHCIEEWLLQRKSYFCPTCKTIVKDEKEEAGRDSDNGDEENHNHNTTATTNTTPTDPAPAFSATTSIYNNSRQPPRHVDPIGLPQQPPCCIS